MGGNPNIRFTLVLNLTVVKLNINLNSKDMPNYVRNRVTVFGKRSVVLEIMKNIGNEGEVIDFEKIIPMPRVLYDVTCPHKIVTEDELKKELAEIAERRKKNPNDYMGFTHNLTQKMYDSYMKKYGAVDWYDWSIQNWGTKWNCSESSLCDDLPDEKGNPDDDVECSFEFDTAWSTPFGVIAKLSQKYPTVEITVRFADEDAGQNCGIYTLRDEKIIGNLEPEPGSTQAMKLYLELHEYAEEYYNLVDGEYIYKEEGEDDEDEEEDKEE